MNVLFDGFHLESFLIYYLVLLAQELLAIFETFVLELVFLDANGQKRQLRKLSLKDVLYLQLVLMEIFHL